MIPKPMRDIVSVFQDTLYGVFRRPKDLKKRAIFEFLKSRIVFLLALIFGASIFVHFALAATITFEVNNGVACDDNTADSSVTPYCTIQAAVDGIPINLVTDGNNYVVNVHSGTYTEAVAIGGKTTDATHIITLQENSGDIAIIDVTTVNSGNSTGIQISSNYVIVNGFEIRNLSGAVFTGNGGVNLSGVNNVNIINNVIHGFDGGNAGGVRIGSSTSNTIDGNEIYGNNEGIFFLNNAGGGNSITNNVIHNNTNRGIVFGTGYTNSDIFKNNIIRNEGNAIFDFGGGSHTYENNTFYNNTTALVVANGTNPIIKNNIFASNTTAISSYTGFTHTVSWNLFNGNSNNIFGGGTFNTPTAIDNLGSFTEGNIVGLDPLFVNPGTNDFTLQSTSPAINAGDPASAFANEPTQNGGRINMGAYGNTSLAATSSNTSPTVNATSGTIFGAPTLTDIGGGVIQVDFRLSDEGTVSCDIPSGQTNYPAGLQYSLDGGTTWNYSSNITGNTGLNCTNISLGDSNLLNFNLFAEVGNTSGTVDVRLRATDGTLMSTQWTTSGSLAFNFTGFLTVDQNDGGCNAGGPVYCTISQAIAVVPAVLTVPTTITVNSGTYNENVFVNSKTTSAVNTLTIKVNSGNAVIIDGTSLSAHGFQSNGVDYVTFDGFEVRNFPSAGIKIDLNAQNNVVKNNIVHTNGAVAGIWLGNGLGVGQGADNTQVLNNTVYLNTGSGIILGDDSSNNTIQGNVVYSNTSDGVTDFSTSNNTYSNNIIYSNGGSGINDTTSNSSTIQGNIIYSNTVDGISFNDTDGGVSSGIIVNNTLYNNGSDGIEFLPASGTFTVKNNIISSNTVKGVNTNSLVPPLTLTVNYNLFYNNTLGNIDSIVTMSAINALAYASNNIVYDPLFTDPDGADNILGGSNGVDDDFTEQTLAPTINTGNPADAFANELAPNGGRINIGAYGNTVQAATTPIDSLRITDSGGTDITEIYDGQTLYFELVEYDSIGTASIPITITTTSGDSETVALTPSLGPGVFGGNVSFAENTLPVTSNGTVEGDIGNTVTADWAATLQDTVIVITTPLPPVRITDASFNDITTISSGQNVYFEVNDASVAGAGPLKLLVTSAAGDNEVFTLTEGASGQFRSSGISFSMGTPTLQNGTLEGSGGGTLTAEYFTVEQEDDMESYTGPGDIKWADPSIGGPTPTVAVPPGGLVPSIGPFSPVGDTKIIELNAQPSHVFGAGAGTFFSANANFTNPSNLTGKKIKVDVYISDTSAFDPVGTIFGGALTTRLKNFHAIIQNATGTQISTREIQATSFNNGGWASFILDPNDFTVLPGAGFTAADIANIEVMSFVAVTGNDVTGHTMAIGIDNVSVGTVQSDTVSIIQPDGMYITDSTFTGITSQTLGNPISFEYVNAASAGSGTAIITVTTSSGDTETITLTEVGSSGQFRRQNFPTADAAVSAEDGTIQVAPNGTITATLGGDSDNVIAIIDNVIRITDSSFNSISTVSPGDDIYFELSRLASAGSVTLVASISSTVGGSETITLTETGPSSGIFRSGALATRATGDSTTTDLILNVANGDTITANFLVPGGGATIDNFEAYINSADLLDGGSDGDGWQGGGGANATIISSAGAANISTNSPSSTGGDTQFVEKFVNAAGSNFAGEILQSVYSATAASRNGATSLNFGTNGIGLDVYLQDPNLLSSTGYVSSLSLHDLTVAVVSGDAATNTFDGASVIYVDKASLSAGWNTLQLTQSQFAAIPASGPFPGTAVNWSDVELIAVGFITGDASSSGNSLTIGLDNISILAETLTDTATVQASGIRITDSAFIDVTSVTAGSTVYFEYSDTSATGTGPITITITTTLGDSEPLALTETPINSGRFRGSLPLASGTANISNGAIEAADGNILTSAFQTFNVYDDFENYTDIDAGRSGGPIKITSLTGGYGWIQTKEALSAPWTEPDLTVGNGGGLLPQLPGASASNQFVEKQADTTVQDLGIILEAIHTTPGGVSPTNMIGGLTFDAYINDPANIDFVTGTVPPVPPLKGYAIALASGFGTPSAGAAIHQIPSGSIPNGSWFTVGPLDPTTVWADEATLLSNGDPNTDFFNGNFLFGSSGTFDPANVQLVAIVAIVGPGNGTGLPLGFSTLTVGMDNIKSTGTALQDTVTVSAPTTPSGGTTPPPAGGSDTPSAPTPLAPQGIGTDTIRWNFQDNATNEIGFTLIDDIGGVINTQNVSDLTFLDETGLQTNTQYSGRSVIALGSGGANSNQSFFTNGYTAIETPQSINAELTLDTMIRISANSAAGPFTNLSSGQSGLLFENVTLGTSSGWIQSNLWDSGGLTPGQAYTFRVTARNGNGDMTASVETSIVASGAPQPVLSLVMGVAINLQQIAAFIQDTIRIALSVLGHSFYPYIREVSNLI